MLDPDLIAFVRNSLRSVWALEVLLLLRRHAPRAVPRDEIVRELRATRFLVRRIVDQLVEENLVVAEANESARFQASTPEHERLCGMLERASRDRPIALRDIIIANPDAKLRSLADAFRFKDKEKDK